MAASSENILQHLSAVESERQRRVGNPSLQARVTAVKTYQQQRFAHTYADLLASPRYRDVARFFLDELYGPKDFAERDAQFARVVPALTRLFPSDVLLTVESLAALHALSESLDSAMGNAVAGTALTAADYLAAWQACGRRADRERQVALTVKIGESLDQLTRRLLLRQSLRMMRVPARAAGLSSLQSFLESGFDTFHAMRGAAEFLKTVRSREMALMQALFASEAVADGTPARAAALGELP
jgi:hypothetical protein